MHWDPSYATCIPMCTNSVIRNKMSLIQSFPHTEAPFFITMSLRLYPKKYPLLLGVCSRSSLALVLQLLHSQLNLNSMCSFNIMCYSLPVKFATSLIYLFGDFIIWSRKLDPAVSFTKGYL